MVYTSQLGISMAVRTAICMYTLTHTGSFRKVILEKMSGSECDALMNLVSQDLKTR